MYVYYSRRKYNAEFHWNKIFVCPLVTDLYSKEKDQPHEQVLFIAGIYL